MKFLKPILSEIDLHLLKSWEYNDPERTKDDKAMKQLMICLKKTNTVSPLTVLHLDNGLVPIYVVIDGHRRKTALEKLGEKKVWCCIYKMSEIKIPIELFFTYFNTSKKITELSQQFIYQLTRTIDVLNEKQQVAAKRLMNVAMNKGNSDVYEHIDYVIRGRKSLAHTHYVVTIICKYCKKDIIF